MKRIPASVMIGRSMADALSAYGTAVHNVALGMSSAFSAVPPRHDSEEKHGETSPPKATPPGAQKPQSPGKPEVHAKNGTVNRHPLHLAADGLKEAFSKLGFHFVDNGEGLEVEEADITFPTWEEPADIFGWQSDPVYVGCGHILLRTRILPAHLRSLTARPPVRLVACGRVFQNDPACYMHDQIEGIVAEEGMTLDDWHDMWNRYAVTLFGLCATARLEAISDGAYQIIVCDELEGATYHFGYTGPASAKAKALCG